MMTNRWRERLWAAALILPAISTPMLRAEVPFDPPGVYRTSWFGNTYMDTRGKQNVPEEFNDLCVSANGQVFSAGYAEAFGGGASYNATNGAFLGRYGGFDSGFGDPVSVVAASDRFVYFGAGTQGILRAPHGGSQGPYTTFGKGTNIQGLFLKDGFLYASDFGAGRIRVFNTTNRVEVRSWPCPNPTRLTVDASGNVWVVIYSATSAQPPSGGPMWWGEKVASFSPTGTPGPEITDFERPLSVAIDPSGRLLVGGLNAHSQIWKYDISGVPTKVGTFGAEKGIFAGTPGAFTDSAKLHWIKAIAVDAAGDLYTGSTYGTFWGACVEKWNADGGLQWRVFAGTSLDCAGIDPENETEVYSKYHHYSLDYSQAKPGTEWSLKGFTVDRFKYPNDPRVDQNTDVGSRSLGAGVWRIGGQLFMARGSQEGYRFELFRQERTTDGEVLVPSVIMGAGGEPNNKFYDPQSRTWSSKPKMSNMYNQYWDIAKNGDLFTIGDPNTIIQYQFGGLDTNRNPVWTASNATATLVSEFEPARRLHYDSDADIMYMAGDVKDQNWGSFLKVKKFTNWSTGNRKSSYTVSLPYRDPEYAGSSHYGGGDPVAFSVAGDYLFVAYGTGHVRILNKTDGTLVGTLRQKVNGWTGSDGQVDAAYGMTATRRSNGEYIILLENAAWGNIQMYRWCPNGACEESKPTIAPPVLPADGRVDGHWPSRTAAFVLEEFSGLGSSAAWSPVLQESAGLNQPPRVTVPHSGMGRGFSPEPTLNVG